MNSRNFATILPFCIFLYFQTGFCQIKLPALISDGMVLQRNTEIKIWAWAKPQEQVSIQFNGANYQTIANDAGEWEIRFPNLQVGGPYSMKIQASDTIEIKDIVVGDVWVCSGQSNMELNMRRVSPMYEAEIAQAENSNIRYFAVPQKYNFNAPQKDLQLGVWKKANPQNVLDFSAVAYFFAKELYDKYKVPIGLINASLGGSPAEAWMSENALKAFPHHYQEAQKFKDSTLIKQIENQDNTRIQVWYNLLKEKDEGYKGKWYNPDLNTDDWTSMKIPGYWAETTPLGQVNGVVWFKKKINIPAFMLGKSTKLILGRIVDADSVFVNGTFVGTTGYQYPPRRYEIPTNVLKAGENTIIIRIINNAGKGGFVLDKQYAIISENQSIDLKGDWQYKLGAKMDALGSQTFIRWKPMGLFNAMIAPLLNYCIKGVIWYQGESNTNRAEEYQTLFPAMIHDWRKNWNQGDFPFLFVQLANFMEAKDQPSESNWAELREAQLKVLSLVNTGMAVSIDIGEWNDIHPLNKKDLGHRLALAAQRAAYGDKKAVHSGPTYQSMEVQGNKIVLSFTNTGSGLISRRGEELKHFAIAGADKKFIWAKAEIQKNKVIVWSDEISKPVAVRYAWADNPEGANLYNQEGLPAAPFRTDE